MSIIANPQYTEITTNTTLVAVPGKQYFIKNTDTNPHDVTYGANSLTLEASQTGQFIYAGSSWISGFANSSSLDTFEALEITVDTTLTAIEGKQYLVKNTDSSTHTITYGSDTTTLQQNFTGIFFYVNSAWVYTGAWNKDGDFVAGGDISALGTITGASVTPSLYDFYDQRVMEEAPGTKYSGTTWENVSERACFYHLSASSGGAVSDIVTRDEVEHDNGSGVWSIDKEYAFADLVYDDVIGGTGTHAGKYVVEVNEFSGLFERFEGDTAETFENGFQGDQFQGFGFAVAGSNSSSFSNSTC